MTITGTCMPRDPAARMKRGTRLTGWEMRMSMHVATQMEPEPSYDIRHDIPHRPTEATKLPGMSTVRSFIVVYMDGDVNYRYQAVQQRFL